MEKSNESLKKDKDFYHDLKALGDTEGGKILINGLVQDALNAMHWLSNSYENPGINDLDIRSKCARLQVSLSMLGTLKNAKTNEEDIDKLIEEALRG